MTWLYLVALVLLGVIATIFVGRWRGAAPVENDCSPSDDALSDADPEGVVERARRGEQLRAEDLEEIRFDSGLRGYRMDQVDALLDVLSVQLKETQRRQEQGTQE